MFNKAFAPNGVNLIEKLYKDVFLYEKTHRYLKNHYQFFDALKTKDRKIRGNCNFLTKVKFHELERSFPLSLHLCLFI